VLIIFLDPSVLIGQKVEIADDSLGKFESPILMILAILTNKFSRRHIIIMLIANIRIRMIIIWVVTHAFHLRALDLKGSNLLDKILAEAAEKQNC